MLDLLRGVGDPFVQVEFDVDEAREMPRQDHRGLDRTRHGRRDNRVNGAAVGEAQREGLSFSLAGVRERDQVNPVTAEAVGIRVVVERPRLSANVG